MALILIGKFGLPESGLPANAAARFVINLVDFHDEPPELPAMSIQEKMVCGRRKKDRGNLWYAKEEFQFAIQCYRYETKS